MNVRIFLAMLLTASSLAASMVDEDKEQAPPSQQAYQFARETDGTIILSPNLLQRIIRDDVVLSPEDKLSFTYKGDSEDSASEKDDAESNESELDILDLFIQAVARMMDI